MAKPPAFIDPDPYSRAPQRQGKVPLPGPGELAELIREGFDVHEVAAMYDRGVHAIRQHLSNGGRSAVTGEPVGAARHPVDLTTGPDKPFEYPAWMDDANCAGTDPEAFFPEKGGSTREAKKVCSRCPVQAECLDYAVDNDERFGIFGGLSERERRRIKRILTGPPQPREVQAPNRHTLARAWAVAQGIEVPVRGRVPLDVIEQYDTAHPEEPTNQQESA